VGEIVNLNGRITPAADAKVSVFDRSFLFGDGVYESLRTYGGRMRLLERHLDRLEISATRLAIPLGVPRGQLASEVEAGVAAAGNAESLVRIVISRGEGFPDGDPAGCATAPNRAILVRPFRPLPPRLYEEGTHAVVVDVRRNDRRSLDPAVKSNNLLNNLLGSMEAYRRGAPEGILLNLADEVAEGTSSNVFMVAAGSLRTPSLECGILSGITREVVLEVARANGVAAREERIPLQALREADEIFLTSTTRELLPVVRLDGRPVGDGHPGALTRRLHALFRARVGAA
jgi:branched-chain amino acid aminotransferase